MGLSSSKQSTTQQSTSTSSPYGTAQPYIDAGLAASNNVFNAQQPVLAGLASTAQGAFNSIAPGAFQTSPYVSSAQNAAAGIYGGGTNNNPGASTYSAITGGANPGLGLLSGLAGGGTNTAIPGISSLAYGTGSLGAGDATLASFADPNSANPYVDAITQQATDAAAKATNQRFGASGLGAGLSSAYTGALGSAVANANNTTRYGAYNDAANRALTAANDLSAGSRSDAATRLGALNNLSAADQQQFANQQGVASSIGTLSNADNQTKLGAAQASDSSYNAQVQAALSALGLTSSLTNAQYAGIDPALNLLNASATIPYTGVNALAGSLNTLAGRYGTTSSTGSGTTTSNPSLISSLGSLVQTGGDLASLFASDRRLKTGVEKIGELEDGLPVYTYDYVWGGRPQIGVMADEVAEFRPWALGPAIGGYSTVNYGAL
jgi:hypothetical protein